jgi:malate synthase
MAFNALNAAVRQNMPDFEDAAPSHFEPSDSVSKRPATIFAALRNAKEIFAGAWDGRVYEVEKKGKKCQYRIGESPSQWPTRFVRPPSIHLRFDQFQIDGRSAPAMIVLIVIWVLNNYDALTAAGTGVYFYIPKMQTPREALIVETLLARLEGLLGLAFGSFKVKALYEEGNGGRFLPVIAWVLRRRLLGTNVGRWDYLGSLIEMWKDDPNGVFPDPQSIGMASPNMIAYQKFNATVMLMAGMKNGELTQGAPIGGMAAVMIYNSGDPYGRSAYNPLALRAMLIDKLRERLLGLTFIPDEPTPPGQQQVLEEILAGNIKGRLYDTYRQSWVASPEAAYVAAGNIPLQCPVSDLQSLLDAPLETLDVRGKSVPSVKSGLSETERKLLCSIGLVNSGGRITPRLLAKELLTAPEDFLTPELWNSIYAVPAGGITPEHIQHAFYMAANYGFQILNGNFAAAIDDYELSLRFMNDLATYRINVSWLWVLLRHQAVITRGGFFKGPVLTADGVVPALNALEIKAGTRFTRELFEQVWLLHDQWTEAFFAELDRRGDPGRFDRSKAPLIMALLKQQLLSSRYIQHSARVIFAIAEAGLEESGAILEAIFDLSRDEIVASVHAGTMKPALLAIHDYVFDIFEGAEIRR